MTRLILFLIRLKLGVKKYEKFKFTNQKQDCYYYFSSYRLTKVIDRGTHTFSRDSRVSFNWLLSPECEVYKC